MWTCNGSYGGSNASCSAVKLNPTSGICGLANGELFVEKPVENLCDQGTHSDVSGDGNPWYWTCAGVD